MFGFFVLSSKWMRKKRNKEGTKERMGSEMGSGLLSLKWRRKRREENGTKERMGSEMGS